jgi:matrix metalloproteinase-14 (membrane-inserted)
MIIEQIIEDINMPEITHEVIKRVIAYLIKYKYIDIKDEVLTIDIGKFKDTIAKFQEAFGLKVDGIVGPKTLAAMEWPRCGCPEYMIEQANEKMYKFGTLDLTYYINGRDSDLSASDWDQGIRDALDSIEDVCGLLFTRVNDINKANLVYGVGRGRAHDFDGPSGTLAWFQIAPSTNFRGQVSGKFDLDENWVYKQGRGIKFVNVACHETLHGLGLFHSNVSSALMAPFYSPDIAKPQQNDDITRLQARYGKPRVNREPKPVPTPVPTPTPTPTPEPKPGELHIIIQGDKITIPGYRVQQLG